MTHRPHLEPTARHLEILRWVSEGYTDKEIAEELGLSEFTVRTHSSEMLHRMGAVNRAQAVTFGFRQGMLT